MIAKATAVAALAFLTWAFAACDEGGEKGESAIREFGQAPVFWRPVDVTGVDSLDEPLPLAAFSRLQLRVTNGYAEDRLRLTATPLDEEGPVFERSMLRLLSGPSGPGEHYIGRVALPAVGRWRLTAHAGNDEASIEVQIAPCGRAQPVTLAQQEEAPPAVVEVGEPPIFFRNTQGIRASEPHRVVARVTCGYHGEELPLIAAHRGPGALRVRGASH